MNGYQVSTLREGDEEIPIVARMRMEERAQLSDVQNLYDQAKNAAEQASDAAASYAKGAYENSGDTFRDGSQAIANKVQENPLGSMLIAGAIGFALGLLMTRQPRRLPRRPA